MKLSISNSVFSSLLFLPPSPHPASRLKQNYEVHLSTQHLVPLVDIYAQYVLYCSSQGKNDFLNNAEFIKVLRYMYMYVLYTL